MKTSEIMGEMYLEIVQLRRNNEDYKNNIGRQQRLISELQDRIEELEYMVQKVSPVVCDSEEKLADYEKWVESQEEQTVRIDDIKPECIGKVIEI